MSQRVVGVPIISLIGLTFCQRGSVRKPRRPRLKSARWSDFAVPADCRPMKTKERSELFMIWQTRFEKNMHRHAGMAWMDVRAKLEGNRDAVRSLHQMEATGGEPDVLGDAEGAGILTFCDCSEESPLGRRSTCYDAEARRSRKEHKPGNSAVEMSVAMGIDILTEQQYRKLQEVGEFDTKTSSWIRTPPEVRELGGALFCDRRYGKVFVYHNGAQSYYAARGFRGALRV